MHIDRIRAKAKGALNSTKSGNEIENYKKLFSIICRSKIDYGSQLYSISVTQNPSINRVCIRIYIFAYRKSPVETLHVEGNDLPLELRRIKFGPRFLHKMQSLFNLDNREDENYTEKGDTT